MALPSPPEYPLELAGWVSKQSITPEETENEIRQTLLHTQWDVDLIDLEIIRRSSTSSQSIARLLELRGTHVARLREMRGAISPLKRFPPEILGKIFVHFTGGTVVLPPKPQSNPWKLGHVSAFWREVLWNTPEVWVNITVHSPWRGKIGIDGVEAFTNVRQVFNEIISRSRASFTLRVEQLSSTPLTDLILPLIDRFTSLSLAPLPYNVLRSLLDLPPGSLDSIERLTIKVFHDSTLPFPRCPAGVPYPAPNLKHLGITFITPPPTHFIPSSLLRLPSPQLNYLAIFNAKVPWSVAHRILAQCPLLVQCSLTIGYDSKDTADQASGITLAHLENLEFVSGELIDFVEFLSPFTFPSLRCLTIRPGPFPLWPAMVHPSPGIDSLVVRSNCQLEFLSLGGDLRNDPTLPAIDPSIETLLQASPTLTVLVGSLILPPSIFVEMQSGLLSELKCITVRLRADGLRVFLDLLDYHIHKDDSGGATYNGCITYAAIWCYAGQGAQAVYRRYQNNASLYRGLGIRIRVYLEVDLEELGNTANSEEDEDDSDSDTSTDDEREPVRGVLQRYLGSFFHSFR